MTMEKISRAFEWIAVAELVLAFVIALGGVVRNIVRGVAWPDVYSDWRAVFGRGLLVGIEILVAADLIRTIAVEPTLENVAVLGLIVLVRVVLSFSLDVEIEGVLPWRMGQRKASGDSR